MIADKFNLWLYLKENSVFIAGTVVRVKKEFSKYHQNTTLFSYPMCVSEVANDNITGNVLIKCQWFNKLENGDWGDLNEFWFPPEHLFVLTDFTR